MNLDVRQRAMLREMGVRVWQPAAPVEKLAQASELIAAEANASSAKAKSDQEIKSGKAFAALSQPEAPAAPSAKQHADAARTVRLPPVPATPASIPQAPASGAPDCWRLGQAQTLYTDALQAGGARWLVLAQLPPAGLEAPAFDGDAGRLLANMLRAARLPLEASAVIFAPLVRLAISGSMDEFSAALSALIGQARPDIVLVMGRLAGQALLDSSEPFGKLRGRPHALEGCTTVVTYDAPYLLRCPLDKARAWDDLCLAMGLAARPA